jgi:fatty-acyl-CoA synthase
VDPAVIYPLIAEHNVSMLCAAPIVLTMLIHAPDGAMLIHAPDGAMLTHAPDGAMLIHAPDSVARRFDHEVRVFTGGAAPPSPVIAAMERRGFTVGHVYGLTEVYGPLTYNMWQPGIAEMALDDRARFLSRQGVPYATAEDATVMDATMTQVPADGATMGELMLRGNTVMKGYLKNPAATDAAFAGGWFHSGDLGVLHPDGYIEIKDRSKDIIISGGENISSLEVEDVLYRHPDIMEAAVVAQDDETWGEVPHAFVTTRPGVESLTEADVIAFCRAHMARFKAPKHVTFTQLPKTSTGKIQKYELRRQLKAGLV